MSTQSVNVHTKEELITHVDNVFKKMAYASLMSRRFKVGEGVNLEQSEELLILDRLLRNPNCQFEDFSEQVLNRVRLITICYK